jgi:hypothetical protein
VILVIWWVAGCAPPRSTPASATSDLVAAPLFNGIAPYRREVTTSSQEAQRYFDQGLALVYAFNHDEAIRSFRRATELDPGCAMAWWGLAYANGPHINKPAVDETQARAAFAALAAARAAVERTNETERALIGALEKRYADPQPPDRTPLDQAYADAMREVWQSHPNGADAGALFAEAMRGSTSCVTPCAVRTRCATTSLLTGSFRCAPRWAPRCSGSGARPKRSRSTATI